MRIFVIEGLDCSGKTTQCEMLKKKFKVVKFPGDSNSIKAYLSGEYGDKVNPYAVSSFFALDRYLTMRNFREHETLICDRYITSNFIYAQQPPIEWQEYYEYTLLGNPPPEDVIFLNMPPSYAKRLMKKRGTKKDIYESDYYFQKKIYKVAMNMAKEKGWRIINCVDKGKIKTPEQIHAEIVSLLDYLVYNIAF
jgi:dTMP kinase